MAKKKKKKTKVLTPDVGIIHSGTSGKHAGHIKAFKDGLALFSNATPRNPKYANDHHGTLDTDATALINAGVNVLHAAGGSRSAHPAKDPTRTHPGVAH